MRMKTPVNKKTIQQHLADSGWKYLLMAVLVVLGWTLIYDMTQYRSPEDKRVDVYVLSSTASQEALDAFLKPIWEEVTPDVETVNGFIIPITDESDITLKLGTYTAAWEGDIYVLTAQYYKMLAAQGAFLDLEALIADGQINADEIDLSSAYVAMIEEYDQEGRPITAEQHLYGIPLDTLYGYMETLQLDNRGMYAAILIRNQNDEKVIPFFNAFIQGGRGEKPEWLEENP